MDYVIRQEDEDTIGEALTDRAKKIYGEGPVSINVDPHTFMANFPPLWELGYVDDKGTLRKVTTNRLH